MKILIVEDDNFKLAAIRGAIPSTGGNTDVDTAKSLHDAMAALEARVYDFVVLDMAIPSHTSDVGAIDTYSQPVGGLDVLLFISSGDRPEKVAILTQYPTIEYNRRHVPLRDFAEILHKDDVRNVTSVIMFGEDRDWKGPLLEALGVEP